MERIPDVGGLFEAFKNTLWFKTTTWGRLYIHSWVFSMFNSMTSSFCTLSAFLVSSRQFFGEPILCDSGMSVGGDHSRSSWILDQDSGSISWDWKLNERDYKSVIIKCLNFKNHFSLHMKYHRRRNRVNNVIN